MLTPAEFWRLLRAAAQGWWNDRCMSMGAAIAYYTLFAFAPLLLAAIAVAGLVFGPEAARGAIVAEIGGLIGVKEAKAIEDLIAGASAVRPGVIGAVVGGVTFLLLVTGVFVELEDSLNLIWRAKPPPWRAGVLGMLRSRLLSLAMVLAIGFLLLVSLVFDAALSAAGAYLGARLEGFMTLIGAVNFLAALAMAVVLFALIFKVLPDTEIAWRDVWVGAAVTGLLSALGKFLIGLYLGRSGVATSYGAAAAVITILLWVYYSSQILLFGAEFTKVYAERRGSRSAGTGGA